jgi:hypothetical protein
MPTIHPETATVINACVQKPGSTVAPWTAGATTVTPR